MDLLDTYNSLLKESLMLKSYRHLKLWQAILVALVLLPFILSYVLIMLIYGIAAIIYKLISCPFDYLYGFVKQEGKEVNHATQAVIYIVAFPLIFFLRCIMAFMIFYMSIVHLSASLDGYVATFGGITFSPFLLNPADRSAKTVVLHSSTAVNVFIIVGIILICIALFFTPVVNWIYNLFDIMTYSEFLNTVTAAFESGLITIEDFNEFLDLCNDGTITSSNYEEYIQDYLGPYGTGITNYKWMLFATIADYVVDIIYYAFAYIFVFAYKPYKVKKKDKAPANNDISKPDSTPKNDDIPKSDEPEVITADISVEQAAQEATTGDILVEEAAP